MINLGGENHSNFKHFFHERRLLFEVAPDPRNPLTRLDEAEDFLKELKTPEMTEQERQDLADIQVPVDETRERVVRTGLLTGDIIEGVEGQDVQRERSIQALARLKKENRREYERIVSRCFGVSDETKVGWTTRFNARKESRLIVDSYLEASNQNIEAFRDADGKGFDFYGTNRFETTNKKGEVTQETINWIQDSISDIEAQLKRLGIKKKEFFAIEEVKAFRELKSMRASKLKDFNHLDNNDDNVDFNGINILGGDTFEWRRDSVSTIKSKLKRTASINNNNKAWVKRFMENPNTQLFFQLKEALVPVNMRTDANGNPYNFNGVNRFEYTDDTGTTQEITINWKTDSVSEIKQKLDLLNLREWFEQSREGKAFLDNKEGTKAMHGIVQDGTLQTIIDREGATIGGSSFDSEKLLDALYAAPSNEIWNDADAVAWNDADFQNQLNYLGHTGLTPATLATLTANEQAQVNEALASTKEKLKKRSPNHLLKTILGDDIHDFVNIDNPDHHAGRATLNYIVGRLQNPDPNEQKELIKFLQLLANEPSEAMGGITALRNTIAEFTATIKQEFGELEKIEKAKTRRNDQIAKLDPKVSSLQVREDALVADIASASGDAQRQRSIPGLRADLERVTVEKTKIIETEGILNDELAELETAVRPHNQAIIAGIVKLGNLLRKHEHNREIWTGNLENIFNDPFIRDVIMKHAQNPPAHTDVTSENTFITDFANELNTNGSKAINTLDDNLEQRLKTERIQQNLALSTTGKLDIRTLGTLLLDNALLRAGDKDETKRFKRAALTFGLHEAQCANSDQAIYENKATARSIHGSDVRRAFREVLDEIKAKVPFTEKYTAESAIAHITTNDAELHPFRKITPKSTPHQIRTIIEKHNRRHPEKKITSATLAKFIARINKFMTGINIPGKDGTFRIIDSQVGVAGHLANNLRSLSEVLFVDEYIEAIPKNAGGDKQQHLVQIFAEKNEARREVDKQIKAMMENTADEFHEYLNRDKVQARYNAAIEQARAEQGGTFWEALKEAGSEVISDGGMHMEQFRTYHKRKYSALNKAMREAGIPKSARMKGPALKRLPEEVADFATYALKVPTIMTFQLARGLYKAGQGVGAAAKGVGGGVKAFGRGTKRFWDWFTTP